MKTTVLTIAIAVLLVLAALSIRPVEISRKGSLMVRGIIKSVSVNSSHDLEIVLADDNRTFYVNRAADRDLDIPQLMQDLPARTATLLYADQWTILDPFGSTKHITELTVDSELIFSEIQ